MYVHSAYTYFLQGMLETWFVKVDTDLSHKRNFY